MRNILILTILKFALLGLVHSANGQEVQVRVLKQECTPYTCERHWHLGIGSFVGRDGNGDWLVITAGHCLRSEVREGPNGVPVTESVISVELAVPDNGELRWKPAIIGPWKVNHEQGVDVGVIRFRSPLKFKTRELGRDDVEISETVQYVNKKGRMETAEVTAGRNCYSAFNVPVQNGNSGAPVVYNGLFVGIISNIDPPRHRTYFMRCRCVNEFLRSHRISVTRAEHEAPTPLPRPQAPGHDARPVAGAGCECQKQIAALRAEVSALKQESAKQANGFQVVFSAGDDPDEPSRHLQVRPGETLEIPPAELRFRNVDPQGNQIGEVFVDKAPLGQPLMLRYERSEKGQ